MTETLSKYIFLSLVELSLLKLNKFLYPLNHLAIYGKRAKEVLQITEKNPKSTWRTRFEKQRRCTKRGGSFVFNSGQELCRTLVMEDS